MSEKFCAESDQRIIADPARLLKAALFYGSLGLAVFPCEVNGKRPLARLAPKGVNSAATAEITIREWWRQCPTANIGLRAGEGLLILDLDCKNGENGLDDLMRMQEELGVLPPTPYAVTPSGGYHLFFLAPDAAIVGQTKIKWQGKPTAIDLRIGAQYVVAAPSVIDGRDYRFPLPQDYLRRNPDGTLNVAVLPDEWVAALPSRDYSAIAKPLPPIHVPAPPRTALQRVDDYQRCYRYVERMDASISGQGGHNALYRVCCLIFWDFAQEEHTGSDILFAFNSRCQPQWSDSELQHKITDALNPKNKTTARGWRLTDNKNQD